MPETRLARTRQAYKWTAWTPFAVEITGTSTTAFGKFWENFDEVCRRARGQTNCGGETATREGEEEVSEVERAW